MGISKKSLSFENSGELWRTLEYSGVLKVQRFFADGIHDDGNRPYRYHKMNLHSMNITLLVLPFVVLWGKNYHVPDQANESLAQGSGFLYLYQFYMYLLLLTAFFIG